MISGVIDTPIVGTACHNCKERQHYCRATVMADGKPLCDSCINGEVCAQGWAVAKRMYGHHIFEDPYVAPAKTCILSQEERKPVPVTEFKSDWRKKLEADAKIQVVRPKQKEARDKREVKVSRDQRRRYNHESYLRKKAKRDAGRPRCSQCPNIILSDNKCGMCSDCGPGKRKNRHRKLSLAA